MKKEKKQESWSTHTVDPYQVFSQGDENHFAKADNLAKVFRLFLFPIFGSVMKESKAEVTPESREQLVR